MGGKGKRAHHIEQEKMNRKARKRVRGKEERTAAGDRTNQRNDIHHKTKKMKPRGGYFANRN